MPNNLEKDKKDFNWIDYALIIVFFALTVIIYYGFSNKNDLIIGYFVPISLCIVTTIIFFDYIGNVFKLFDKKTQ
jgi:hypothetical protein